MYGIVPKLLTHLSMNQTAEGLVPASKVGHNCDIWEDRILEQHSDPLLRFFPFERDMDLVRIYDRQIELIEQQLGTLARKVHGRDYASA